MGESFSDQEHLHSAAGKGAGLLPITRCQSGAQLGEGTAQGDRYQQEVPESPGNSLSLQSRLCPAPTGAQR